MMIYRYHKYVYLVYIIEYISRLKIYSRYTYVYLLYNHCDLSMGLTNTDMVMMMMMISVYRYLRGLGCSNI